MRSTVLLLLVSCIALNSCKKEKERANSFPNYTYVIEDEMLDYLFKSGSEWTYSNSKNSTVIVATSSGATLEELNTDTANTGRVIAYFSFASTGLNYPVVFGEYPTLAKDSRMHWKSPIYDTSTVFFDLERQPDPSLTTYSYEGQREKMTIGVNTFENVDQFLLSYDPSTRSRFFMSPGIGIVRKEVIVNDTVLQSFDLIDWDVEPETEMKKFVFERTGNHY